MNLICPKCNALNKFDETDYTPGSINTEECWRCGEELSFTIPGVAPEKCSNDVSFVKSAILVQKASVVPAEVTTKTDTELEKARLALEAERIRLEHRKMDHEREMSMLAHQREDSYVTFSEYDKPHKDKITAGLLAILLGGLGAHKFYLGKTGQGILYLLFCWTYIPGILGLVEGIMFLTKDEHDFHKNCY